MLCWQCLSVSVHCICQAELQYLYTYPNCDMCIIYMHDVQSCVNQVVITMLEEKSRRLLDVKQKSSPKII